MFAAGDIAAHALGQAPGRYSVEEAEAAIEALRRDGHLVEAALRGADRAFVTDRALRAERGNIAWMRNGAGAGRPTADAAAVETELAGGPLTEGQREAVRTILLARDRVVGVQGRAGTGKTVMLRETARLAGEVKVVGLAPSKAAVRALEQEAGIPARTLQWFLARHRDIGDRIASPERLAEARLAFGGAVLAVDEASMVSAAQMRQLMRIAERIGIARLALIGDSWQLRSVEAGQPFRQLQQAGMATARMEEILRQRDPDLHEAVEAITEGEAALAMERLGGNVHEAESDELGEAAARLWLSLHRQARARTAILAPTHALREDINEAVREGLRGEGRAARAGSGDRAAGRPRPDARAEGRHRQLPPRRRAGVPQRHLPVPGEDGRRLHGDGNRADRVSCCTIPTGARAGSTPPVRSATATRPTRRARSGSRRATASAGRAMTAGAAW